MRMLLADMRRITLILMHILMHVLLHILMHILIQPPSSYKISNGAETHDPSTHATCAATMQAKTQIYFGALPV